MLDLREIKNACLLKDTVKMANKYLRKYSTSSSHYGGENGNHNEIPLHNPLEHLTSEGVTILVLSGMWSD